VASFFAEAESGETVECGKGSFMGESVERSRAALGIQPRFARSQMFVPLPKLYRGLLAAFVEMSETLDGKISPVRL
jgi:hypothetical protein